MEAEKTLILHGSFVAFEGVGLLIMGPSGSGKSALAADLMGLGADLIADDQVAFQRDGDAVLGRAPQPLAGLLEIRGLGILRTSSREVAPLKGVIDLALETKQRLPEPQSIEILDQSFPLISGNHLASRPGSIMIMLRAISMFGSDEWRL